MSRFAQSTRGSDKTVNYEGAKTYCISPEMELYTTVCTSVLSPRFYVPNDGTEQIRRLIQIVDPAITAALAVYAREEMYLRSVPLVLLVELARIGKLKAETVARVIQRPDEITELLGYYQQANQRVGPKKLNKLSHTIRDGVQAVFESGRFDEYQWAKYNRKTEITFRDAIFLTHPKAKDAVQDALFKKIIDGTLETPYTWETELSAKGNTAQTWQKLIESKRLPYMAMLRNLRNILGAKVSNAFIDQVGIYLSDGKAVEKSKQLPFRFLSAYRELKKVASLQVPYILECLEQAVQYSAANIKGYGLDTNVLIACDVSGSMQRSISENSTVQQYDLGLMLGMLLQARCKSVVSGIFGETWKVIQLPRSNILANADELHRREGEVGYSTNGWKVLEWCVEREQRFDKIMFFTDCQMWDSSGGNKNISSFWLNYKKFNPTAKLYLFDLAGYGTTPLSIRGNDVFLIAGWSDKIFDALAAIEDGNNVLLKLMDACSS